MKQRTRTNRRQKIQTLAANHAANETMSAEVAAVPVAEAARRWGVDARTVRRWCDEGRVNSFLTPGGHRRVSLADIERIQRGDTDMKRSSNGHIPSSLEQRNESLQELRLKIGETKARMDLRQLEDQERQRKEQEEAERLAQENETRREEREREAEQARRDSEREERERQQEESECRRTWLDEQIAFGLTLVPPDVADRFASEIQQSIEESLWSLGPSRPKPIVQRVVRAAVVQAIQPWMREQDIVVAINEGIQEVRSGGYWGVREVEQRARQELFSAIGALAREGASSAHLKAVARSVGQRVVQEQRNQEERERAQQREQQDREKREREVDAYLGGNVLTYLLELNSGPEPHDIEFDPGEIFELAPRIRADLKLKLVQDPSLNWFNAKERIRKAVDDWLENSLNEAERPLK
jgi:excisionase family DNA binding protein